MQGQPDPAWYLDHVLAFAEPGGAVRMPGPAARWQRWWERQLSNDEPVRTASKQGFVISTGQLGTVGVSRSAARHSVARGRWSAPQRGCVAPVTVDDGAGRRKVERRSHALVATAAVLNRPHLVISGRSSAVLHGLPTLSLPATAEVTDRGNDRQGHRPVRHVYAAELADASVTHWFGTAVTTVGRTLVDVARHDRRDGLMAADAALHERLTDRAGIDAELAAAAGWPGVRQAREVLALAIPEAESPLESLVRLALHDSGFPPPEPQYIIGPFRTDLCWPERRLIVEADGLGKYSDETWQDEKRREQALRRYGYRVERVTWDDVLRQWPATEARLWRELRRG